MSALTELQRKVDGLVGRRDQVTHQIATLRTSRLELAKKASTVEEAQLFLQAVAQSTQQQLEYRIGELVTLALQAVLPEPYELKVSFEIKRGKTEAMLLFVDKDGNEVDPMEATGGGAVDVAAFALRVSLWSLRNPRSRSTIVLDEPFRFLSTDLQPKAGVMLQEVSDRLGIQFLIVTHEEELLDAADAVFKVTQTKGTSTTKRIH